MELNTRTAVIWPAIAVVSLLFLGVTAIMALGAPIDASPANSTAATEATQLDVDLTEFEIAPVALEAPAGQPITLRGSNLGQAGHNIALVDGPESPEIAAGDTGAVELGPLAEGDYTLICSLPGHADAGMRADLKVTAGAATPAAASATEASHGGMDATDHSEMTPEEMVAAHNEGIKAFPAESKGKGNQPIEPTIDDGVKVFELTADEIEWEVATGDVKAGMALNGQIPGPRIDVTLGDKVRMVVHNDLDVPTAVHPHGLIVPNSQDGVPGLTQDPIMPGDSFTYEFTVRNAGTHMYHSHFDSAKQVPSGLLGAFIVHEKDEPEVDLDYTMILNDGPLGYTLNGKSFPATEPLAVEQGQTIRVRYMNEGLQIHPMHLHGMPQKVIAKDGWKLAQPHMEDTVLVAPGERVDVLIKATEPGAWAYHCHILNHAEAADGMFGMVTAMVVAE